MLNKHCFAKTNSYFVTGFLLMLLLVTTCTRDDSIRIGFAGELTGLRSGLGVDGRDGAQLAVDLINENGGINGRPLELIIKNDEGVPEVAQEVDSQLIEEGVAGIVGHMTSGQTAAVLDLVNESDVVMVSPTASSDKFTGQADNFFRVMPTTAVHGRALAHHIYNGRHLNRIVGVYDLANRSFAETLWFVIRDEFEALGGNADLSFSFISDETDLEVLAQDIVATNPAGVVFVSSDIDTALLAQYIRRLDGGNIALFSSGWALTDELLAKGGSAIDGLEILALYNPESSYPPFLEFNKQFEERFNRPPGFGSAYAYEAVLVLAEGLKDVDNEAAKLPEALMEINTVEGVQGLISLDRYGDVNREVYIAVVMDGQFKIDDALSFEN